jgi:hypothetical protein
MIYYKLYLNSLLGEIASDNTLAGGESQSDVPVFNKLKWFILL